MQAGEVTRFLGEHITDKRHIMSGRRCVIRTYSAGVHIGVVAWVNPDSSKEVLVVDSLRLWKWEKGGLSLSAIANNGILEGRLNETGVVFLTEVIEMIPTNDRAWKTFLEWTEDRIERPPADAENAPVQPSTAEVIRPDASEQG